MDAIASWVSDLSYDLPTWGRFLFFFVAPYILIGLLVRLALLAAVLGGLAGVAWLSLLFVDFVPVEQLSLQMIGLSAAYGAVLATATSYLFRRLYGTVRRRFISTA